MAIGSKNDTKLKGDLNANEILIKSFKDQCRVVPYLLDCRNRAEIRSTFSDILEVHLQKLHPEINFVRQETRKAREEESKQTEEPKLLPKKDDGCTLI